MSDDEDASTNVRRDIMLDGLNAATEILGVNVVRSLSRAIERVIQTGTDRLTVGWEIGRLDKLALQQAREIILKKLAVAAGDSAATDPAIVVSALTHFADDIVRGQANTIDILMQAKEQLELNPPQKDADNEIEDTWLNHFYDLVKHKSSETAQAIFAKVLAEEIKTPGSFSIKTLRILAEMPNQTGEAFQNLCDLSILHIGGQASVICNPFGQPGNNALKEFDLSFSNLTHLIDANLIISELNTHYPIDILCKAPLVYVDIDAFLSKSSDYEEKFKAEEQVNVILFSVVGNELRKIMTMDKNDVYTKRLFDWFKTKGLILNRITQRSIGQVGGVPIVGGD